jgi:hypothetical protein
LFTGLGLLTLALATLLISKSATAGVLHASDKLTDDEKIALVRDLSAEYAIVKSPLPRSRKPLEFSSDGTWDQKGWQKLADVPNGAAARIGDKVQITRIALDGDHLVLEINGGLKDGKKWYDHVEAGIGAGTRPIAQTDSTAKFGTAIDVDFHKPMESLTAGEVKRILAPLLEFDKRTVTQIYTESLPPKVRQAITEIAIRCNSLLAIPTANTASRKRVSISKTGSTACPQAKSPSSPSPAPKSLG